MCKRSLVKSIISLFICLGVFFIVTVLTKEYVYANNALSIPSVNINLEGTDDPAALTPALQIFLLVSVISLAPSLLILLTGFTRIIISLHFLRSAMGTQQMPPNQVLIGVALVLTLYMMGPILTEINENALIPYSEGRMTQAEAFRVGMEPLSRFMRNQAEDADVALFAELSGQTYDTVDDVPDRIIIPAFILGELTKGFIIGFILYLPFIVIDMVVASVLMAMGMMMLPPAMISLPFKILLFLLSGGWSFVIRYVMLTFR